MTLWPSSLKSGVGCEAGKLAGINKYFTRGNAMGESRRELRLARRAG